MLWALTELISQFTFSPFSCQTAKGDGKCKISYLILGLRNSYENLFDSDGISVVDTTFVAMTECYKHCEKTDIVP